jgi:hypothetical protein
MNLEIDIDLYLSTSSTDYHSVNKSMILRGDEVQKNKFLSFLYSSKNLSGYGGRIFDLATATNADMILVIAQYNPNSDNGVVSSLKSDKPTHTLKS